MRSIVVFGKSKSDEKESLSSLSRSDGSSFSKSFEKSNCFPSVRRSSEAELILPTPLPRLEGGSWKRGEESHNCGVLGLCSEVGDEKSGRRGGVVDLYVESKLRSTGVVITMDGDSRFWRGVDLPDEVVGEVNFGDTPSQLLTPAANLRDKLLLFGVYFGVSNEMRFLCAREMLDGVW